MGIRSQPSRKASAPASLSSDSHMLHTAKGERRLREKIDREGGVENLSADEQGKIIVWVFFWQILFGKLPILREG